MMPDTKQPQTMPPGMPGLGMMPDQAPAGDLESRVSDLEAKVQALEDQLSSSQPGQ